MTFSISTSSVLRGATAELPNHRSITEQEQVLVEPCRQYRGSSRSPCYLIWSDLVCRPGNSLLDEVLNLQQQSWPAVCSVLQDGDEWMRETPEKQHKTWRTRFNKTMRASSKKHLLVQSTLKKSLLSGFCHPFVCLWHPKPQCEPFTAHHFSNHFHLFFYIFFLHSVFFHTWYIQIMPLSFVLFDLCWVSLPLSYKILSKRFWPMDNSKRYASDWLPGHNAVSSM